MRGFLVLSAILAALLGWGFHATHRAADLPAVTAVTR